MAHYLSDIHQYLNHPNKIIIVAGNQLQLRNALDAVEALALDFRDCWVFYFQKEIISDPFLERDRQALWLLESANICGYSLVTRRWSRKKWTFTWAPPRLLKNPTNHSRESLSYDEVFFFFSRGSQPKFIIGHGPWFLPLASIVPEAVAVMVDAGASSLAGRLTRPKILSEVPTEFKTALRTEPDIYFSIFPQRLLGVPAEKYQHNGMTYTRSFAGDLHKEDQSYFISTHSSGWGPPDPEIQKAISLAANDCPGLLYYKRFNESWQEAAELCRTNRINLAVPELGFELDSIVTKNSFPSAVYSRLSTALFIAYDLFPNDCSIVALLPQNPRGEDADIVRALVGSGEWPRMTIRAIS